MLMLPTHQLGRCWQNIPPNVRITTARASQWHGLVSRCPSWKPSVVLARCLDYYCSNVFIASLGREHHGERKRKVFSVSVVEHHFEIPHESDSSFPEATSAGGTSREGILVATREYLQLRQPTVEHVHAGARVRVGLDVPTQIATR